MGGKYAPTSDGHVPGTTPAFTTGRPDATTDELRDMFVHVGAYLLRGVVA